MGNKNTMFLKCPEFVGAPRKAEWTYRFFASIYWIFAKIEIPLEIYRFVRQIRKVLQKAESTNFPEN